MDLTNHEFMVLDHGYVRVVDFLGDDQRVADAARTSYGEGTRSVRRDAGLIRYLIANGHWSPFEQCVIQMIVQCPIFVARQWFRHKGFAINEYSLRYSLPINKFYLPEQKLLQKQSSTNKQGREGSVDDPDTVEEILARANLSALCDYEKLVDENTQLAREIARTILPVSFYTRFICTVNLRDLLFFIKARIDPHAQYEIREYATVLNDIVREWVPITHEAFNKYVIDSITLTKEQMEMFLKIRDGADRSILDDLPKNERVKILRILEEFTDQEIS